MTCAWISPGRSTDRHGRRSSTYCDYHRLRLLEVAQLVTTGAVDLPEDMQGELTKLALSTDPRWILNLPDAPTEQLVDAALEAAARWRAYAVANPPGPGWR